MRERAIRALFLGSMYLNRGDMNALTVPGQYIVQCIIQRARVCLNTVVMASSFLWDRQIRGPGVLPIPSREAHMQSAMPARPLAVLVRLFGCRVP